jgi:fructose-1,6-bisphosphatase/inositol monophosphatase family enzyme
VIACGLPHLGRGDLRSGLRELAPCRTRSRAARFGAAALDLAFVAAGRLDGYWERNISPWDIAAGLMLVREAGGFVTDLDGGDAMFTKAYRCRQRNDPPRIADAAESRRLGPDRNRRRTVCAPFALNRA